MKKYKVFVINLKKDIDRKSQMKKKLSKFNFKVIFFNAITGDYRKNEYSELKRKLFLGRSLLKSEIGCTESHRAILKEIVKTKLAYAVIFEDDILIKDNFEKVVENLLAIDYKWDLIRFNHKNKYKDLKGRVVLKLNDDYFLKRFPKLPGGAYGYLVSLDGAQKILKMSNSYYHPFDILIGQTWKQNLNSLFCTPSPVDHPPVPMHIEENDPRYFKVEKSLLSLYPYTRFFFKLYEAFMKWGHFLYKSVPDYFTRKKY